MSDIIQLLPDHVANQIAAGEVVQRPSSVVKELIENAIDANATLIKLIIKDAGKVLIQVIDNGKGMSVTDARLSFERHATSKIKSADDLFNLHTKGFRGEALASIAAIAHIDLKTKQHNDDIGTHIKIEGSNTLSQDVIVTPTGTSIAVKNLFFNIPARRNFLKSNAVELRHIIDEFHRVSLAHPTISFTLHHNANELFNLPISNYRQRIVSVFGAKINEKLVPVKETTEILKLKGFIGKPEFAKKTRGEQFFFVNNRYIKSHYLNHAVSSAFEGLLKQGTHASYFLYLEVNPETIDINIHPTKTEIKFDDEHTLYAILRAAIKHSLGQFSIAPVLDFEHNSTLDTPYNYKNKQGVSNKLKIDVDSNFNPFKEEKQSLDPSFSKAATYKETPKASWESLYIESKSNTPEVKANDIRVETDEITASFFEADALATTKNTFQLHHKYVVNTIKSGLLIIDQQRAHQRILYEEFLQNITVKQGVSQQLLFPLQLEFTPNEIQILKSLSPQLAQTGFAFSKFSAETVECLGIPAILKETDVANVLEQLMSDIENEVPDTHFSQTDLLAKSLSKSLAIKTGQYLTKDEQEYILNRLFACKEPNISPTNKTTFITLLVTDIDKKFD